MEIYKTPVNRFVAEFIGTSNLLPATMTAGGVRVGETELAIGSNPGGFGIGAEVLLMTRPEEVFVRSAKGEPKANSVAGTVSFVRDIGATIEILVDCNGHEVISVLTPKDWPDVKIGDAVHVELPPTACSVLAP